MRSTRTLAAAIAAVLLAMPAARAADLPPLAPQFHPVVEFSGWYLRGNVGMTNQQVKSLDLVPFPAAFANDKLSTPFLSFDSSPFFGMGVGYQFNQWLRADVTGEYRSKAHFHGQIVGAGVGTSRTCIHNFMDFGATMSGTGGTPIISTTYFADATKWNFAWALYAGLAYQSTPGFTVEFAYRYVDLGKATTGMLRAFDGTVIPTSPFVFNGLTSNDFMLGLRWRLGEPDMMPLMRKG